MTDPADPRSFRPDPWPATDGSATTGTLPRPPAPPPERPSGPGTARVAVIAALVAALVTLGIAVPTTIAVREGGEPAAQPAPVVDAPATGGADIADLAEQLLPSVARVDVATPRGQGSGSAVVYRDDGYLLTNEHVVRDAVEIAVTLPDGTTLEAEVVGADAFNDLAVLHVVDAGAVGPLPVPEFAGDLPRVGETAIAIGSPFELDGSVTAGIISGLGRAIPGTPLRDLIQTDAPINPGNSGGALVDGHGRVIGINTAILPDPSSPGARGNIGIGFAIPVTTAGPLADQLIEQGFVRHAQLGVQTQDIDPRVAEAYGLGVRRGALVVEVVEGSAADDAGLARGDIIVAIGGEEVATTLELVGVIRAHDPGDEVEITFVRGGEQQTARATLGEADQQP